LELPARHHAVLNCEDGHQEKVYDERFRDRHSCSGVNALWHHEVRYEADGVQKSDEEHCVGSEPKENRDEPSNEMALAGARVLVDCLGLGHSLLRFIATTGIAIEKCAECRSRDGRLCPELDLSVRWARLFLESGFAARVDHRRAIFLCQSYA